MVLIRRGWCSTIVVNFRSQLVLWGVGEEWMEGLLIVYKFFGQVVELRNTVGGMGGVWMIHHRRSVGAGARLAR